MRLTAHTSVFPPRGFRLPAALFEVGGVALRVVRLGRAERPTVLALSPPFASPRLLSPLRPLSSGYRLLLADAPPAHCVSALLAAPWLPEHFAVLAASAAIPSALALAEAAPRRVRALVLTGAPTSHASAIGWFLSLPGLGHVAARWLGGRHLPREARLALVREARRGSSWSPAEEARQRVPTLMISGGDDPLGCWRPAGARVECIPEAAHLPFLTHPVAFNGTVDGFLAPLLGRSPRYEA